MSGSDTDTDKHNPCNEAPDKCCILFPIVCGMKTMAVLSILGVSFQFASAVFTLTYDIETGAILTTILIPSFVAAYYFIRYLIDSENKEHQYTLVRALWLFLVTSVLINTCILLASHTTGKTNTMFEHLARAAQGDFCKDQKVFIR